ncbi:MAG: glutamine synthetase III [Oscillospiraceae bacterium]|jgi:glutamine synthetase|nr:glutamine synthetase III [Oscillospiraceae bacterium]
MADLAQTFGSMVFGDEVMRRKLPKDIYRSLQRTIRERKHLDLDVANVVASAMRDWACENGATHFTHWFQPMTGTTAEKHESFIEPDGTGGVLAEFSGKELIRGEPDASSFPTGGIRATFEARGYTAWDPTSYAFLKGNVLCIPTAFCSYSGEALDKKTPLLRSMQAVAKQAVRVLTLLGDPNPPSVITSVGAEQEYFLIDASILDKRPDLLYCGRTLFGGRPPKGQELDDHYFGTIKPRVAAFMAELDEELWKLGILSKTRHNEVAPAQHELAPIYTTTNIAADQNQLTMEMMRVVAARHGLVCLLHEKPFAGVNGSGKHNNWSIGTSTGENLLEPGDTPSENARFLLFLAAVIQAVDDHQDLLRLSIATAGNDHRLGANEAPPAIVSVFLGDELTAILDSVKSGAAYNAPGKSQMTIGVDVLPHFPKDATDRNRTSPFAFTGNKFEFRMPGSSLSISGPNFILNTIIAESLCEFADRLERASDVKAEIGRIIRDTITAHERIIFNGNNYAEEWVREAQARRLLNLTSTVDALPLFETDANIALFEKHGVLSASEVRSRTELLLENYYKTLSIEALTLIEMTRRGVIPAAMAFTQRAVKLVRAKREVSETLSVKAELALAETLSDLLERAAAGVDALEAAVTAGNACAGAFECARHYREEVFCAMQTLRETVDRLEALVPKPYWPYPSYGEILYSVR